MPVVLLGVIAGLGWGECFEPGLAKVIKTTKQPPNFFL
jgi:hypothetical protein